jgi:hypothetical protein
MQCLLCGTEMVLIDVVKDHAMMVPGFEHQTFKCPKCHEIDQRFAFNKQDTVPPIAPSIPEPDGDES